MTREPRQSLDVLVVEDEAIVAMLISDAVEDAGHRVVGVADTLEGAVQLADSARPDLALCDVKLLGGDSGVAVAEALRPMGISCVFVSGNCPDRETGQGLAIGCLPKPFRPSTLKEVIEVASRVRAGLVPGPVPAGMTLY